MTRPEPRPPAAWARLLAWAARRLGTPDLPEDARELFADRAEAHGERAARAWFRRQALAAVARALRLRGVRLRRPRAPGWLSGMSLDVKLGLRMLLKNPGLTGVAVFALALGIPTALWPFHMLNVFETPLPFHEGERIVGLRHSESVMESGEGSLHAFSVWRGTLDSFEEIGAARRAEFNVIPENGPVRPWRGAWITASSFRIARVPPLLGRPLLDADEVVGAPDVVVLGYEPWRTLFQRDPGAVGSTLRIAGTPHTVVGVMPEGFGFPDNEDLWIPLRGSVSAEAGSGPEVWIYGRLAGGVSESQALAELASVEAGLDEAFPEAYGDVRPEIIPYAYLAVGGPSGTRWILAPFQLLALLLLAVACGNVGTLVLARNAARSDELAVRTALGASRARIVSQLFVESLVLALLATGVGLVIGQLAMERFQRLDLWQDELAFWLDFGLNGRTAATALGIAVFCAAVAGVLPALKTTGGGVQRRMQAASAGGAVRFGGATTVLVVVEVALGVLCLFGGWIGWQLVPRAEPARTDVALESFLAARLAMPASAEIGADGASDEDTSRERLVEFQRELARRLAGEAGVRGVAFAGRLPGQYHSMARLEVEGEPLAEWGAGHQVMRASVVPGFFEGLGRRVRAGRGFAASDLPEPGDLPGGAVIVNAALVERVFGGGNGGGGNAIGRRVRYVTYADREPGPWHEIVGVVGSLGMVGADPMPDDAGLYHPAAPGDLRTLRVAIHLAGDPASFAPRLRRIAAEIDPGALTDDPEPLSDLLATDRALFGWLLLALAAVAGTAIVLSVASLYALMAFTVAQRTREIGLRSALGAEPAAIVSVIARRAFAQLALGVFIAVAGSAVFVAKALPGPYRTMDGWRLALAGAAAVVLLVGTLACIGPALRGLRIRPMEALRT